MRFTREGYLPYETQVDAGVNGWYFGNLLFGGLPGFLLIDPAATAVDGVRQMARKAQGAVSLEALRGFEGAGSACYFQHPARCRNLRTVNNTGAAACQGRWHCYYY